jgi:hydrogenase maturation protein HypF
MSFRQSDIARASRRSILVRGIVQGVGFRPRVHGLASRLGLAGFVRNSTDGVQIEVEGAASALDEFVASLTAEAPPLARVDAVTSVSLPGRGERAFRIERSALTAHDGPVLLSPDVATCGNCVRELFDPADRRYRYPFINCTDCGPRLSIIEAAPYDRSRTTMARFAMCDQCLAEYGDPGGRRFHAQANACAACGPRLVVLDAKGDTMEVADPLAHAVDAIRSGEIVALKGLGGYHLACDATNSGAIAALRERKHRDEKPLALMVNDTEQAAALCVLTPEELRLLRSSERPIVLLKRRRGVENVADGIAPASGPLGLMLPSTPLHHLLTSALLDRPLVMTSGNRAEEPTITADEDAVPSLRGVADLFLVHDRRIHLRGDDSVVKVMSGRPVLFRRSRGYAPRTVPLPTPLAQATLAVGGHLKNTCALGSGASALLTPHIGDLDDRRAYASFVDVIAHHESLFGVVPTRLVHDLHPDYASTRYALARGARDGVSLVAVQHHHAHMTSVLAEHQLVGDAIGVTFDGTGYGTDGTVWGGEFLLGDCGAFRRVAHLRPVPLPGGEQAVREPWRAALAHLIDAGQDPGRIVPEGVSPSTVRALQQMVERRIRSPLCSSAGRLFDVAAALSGLGGRTSFEGQAAMALEALVGDAPSDGTYPFGLDDTAETLVVDTRPLVCALLADRRAHVAPATMARRFHDTLAALIVCVCARARDASGVETVALGGGVFQNAILSEQAETLLSSEGFRVYRNVQVPPNDGGLAFGQLAIVASLDARHAEGAA